MNQPRSNDRVAATGGAVPGTPFETDPARQVRNILSTIEDELGSLGLEPPARAAAAKPDERAREAPAASAASTASAASAAPAAREAAPPKPNDAHAVQLAEQRRAWEQEVASRRADDDTRRAFLERRSAELEARAEALESETDSIARARRALAEERSLWLNSQQNDEARRIEQLEELTGRERAIAAREEALALEQARLSGLETSLAEAHQRAVATGFAADLTNDRQTDGIIASLESRLEELGEAVALANQRADQMTTEGLELAQEAERERDQARAALEAMRRRAEALEAEGGGGDRGAGTSSDVDHQALLDDLRGKAERLAACAQHLKRRQGRLRTARRLLEAKRAEGPAPKAQLSLAEMAQQAVAARLNPGEVDGDRLAAQMRHLEQQRFDLTEKKRQLGLAEKRMVRRWARPRAVVVVGWIVLIAVVSALLSWFAANVWSPATVAASVTLEARGKDGAAVTADESAAWQVWHAGLLDDLGFHKTLATRLEERQLPEHDVDSVTARLSRDLGLDLAQPGALTLTLRGDDADEILEWLDVVASTIAVESRRQIEHRHGRVTAAVAGERNERGGVRYATLNRVAIEDHRLLVAQIAFGVIFALVAVLVGVVYRYLAKTRREFDEEGDLFVPSSAPAAS